MQTTIKPLSGTVPEAKNLIKTATIIPNLLIDTYSGTFTFFKAYKLKNTLITAKQANKNAVPKCFLTS